MRRMHSGQHADIVATHAQYQQQVSGLSEGAHLAGELLAAVAIDRVRCQQRTVGAQRNGGQFGALALEARHTAGGKLLGIGGRRAVAAGQDLAPAGDAGQQGLHGIGNRAPQGLRRLVFQVSAVDEMLLDTLLKHGQMEWFGGQRFNDNRVVLSIL